jgi:hypothetical protein
MDSEIRERVAVLEANHETMMSLQQQALTELKAVREELTRYKGFVGGITFIISCVVVSLGIIKDWFHR